MQSGAKPLENLILVKNICLSQGKISILKQFTAFREDHLNNVNVDLGAVAKVRNVPKLRLITPPPPP